VNREPEKTPGSTELVVARYLEPVQWLANVPGAFRITVYDKGGDLPSGIPLPNVGREAHTYLTHIVENYDSLSELTVFCQGHPFDHASDFHRILRAIAAGGLGLDAFEWYGFLVDTDDDLGRRLFVPWSKNENGRELNIRQFHRELFSEEGPPDFAFVGGAQFAVRRELIRQRSQAFYQRALELSMNFPDAAHCYERLWDRVFGVIGIDRGWLAGRQTVRRKPLSRGLRP